MTSTGQIIQKFSEEFIDFKQNVRQTRKRNEVKSLIDHFDNGLKSCELSEEFIDLAVRTSANLTQRTPEMNAIIRELRKRIAALERLIRVVPVGHGDAKKEIARYRRQIAFIILCSDQ